MEVISSHLQGTVVSNRLILYKQLQLHSTLRSLNLWVPKFSELENITKFEPTKNNYPQYMTSHTCTLIGVSRKLASYETAWNQGWLYSRAGG